MYIRFGKPLLDFLMAVSLTIILSWLLIMIALLYPLLGYSRVIFVQQRTGLNLKPFVLYKFRTLKEDDSLSLQERRFRLGSFLRKTSLDELPQLWNILKGEMSFVGPRPLPVEYLRIFLDQDKRRYKIKPGITGLAQVNGRHNLTWERKFEYDLYYVQHVSFLLDCRIMIKTVLLLLSFKEDTSLQEKKLERNE